MEVDDEDYKKCKCECVSGRSGAFIVGSVDIVLGFLGLSFLLLDPYERHRVLEPFTENIPNQFTLDQVGDSFQFLLEFWLPSFFLVILGIFLVFASSLRNRCLIIFCFVLSTLYVGGCIATIFSLLISGRVGLLTFVPFSLITLTQIYFHFIIFIFLKESEPRWKRDDKEMLVINSKA